jgi:hypothetical protein
MKELTAKGGILNSRTSRASSILILFLAISSILSNIHPKGLNLTLDLRFTRQSLSLRT